MRPLPQGLESVEVETGDRGDAALRGALRDPHTQAEALEIVRSLIEQVVVRPATGGGVEVELVGEIAAMVEVATTQNPRTPPWLGRRRMNARRVR